ncbi:MAG: hypothetical protein OXH15_13870 [Gammaproteobacteria bacterium]|nr:hypothetical protein [Gammaproteobacteria bacterium]
MTAPRFDMALVEWTDSFLLESRWLGMDEALGAKRPPCRPCGFVIADTEDDVRLAESYYPSYADEDDSVVSGVVTIPKGAIVSMTILSASPSDCREPG